jgi:hypothetical protein
VPAPVGVAGFNDELRLPAEYFLVWKNAARRLLEIIDEGLPACITIDSRHCTVRHIRTYVQILIARRLQA